MVGQRIAKIQADAMTVSRGLARSAAEQTPSNGLSSADDDAPALDAVRRFNRGHLDATGIDGEVVMERGLIKVAVDRAEIAEIGSAASKGIQASASRRLVGVAPQRSDKCSNDCDPGAVRHILILEIQFPNGDTL
jgi:hypothetical protein